MKKIAMLFLGMLFLLSGCMNISEGDVTSVWGMGNLVTSAAGETGLDLSGVTAVIEAAQDGDTQGARVYFTTEEQVYAEAVLTVSGTEAALCLRRSAEAPESVYVTKDADMVQALNEVMDSLIAEPLPDYEEMTDEEIEAMVAEMQAELDAALAELDPEDLEALEDMSEEDWEAQMAQAEEKTGQMEALLERCIRPGDPRTIDGVEYETTEILVDNDDLVELLNIWGGNENFGQALTNSGCEVTITGTLCEAGELSGMEFAVDVATPEDGTVNVSLSTSQMDDPDVETVTAGVTVDGEEAVSFSMDFMAGGEKTADWLALDLSDAVDLTDMDGEEASRLVGDDCADFIGAALSGVLGRLTSNKLMGYLPW